MKVPRLTALGVIRDGDRIFVSECADPATGRRFYRPLGGAIEFGERGAETVVREVLEEIGEAVVVTRRLGALENLFTYAGEPGHEVVLLYEAAFIDPALTEVDSLPRIDAAPETRRAVWIPLAAFTSEHPPLYPSGLLALLTRQP